MKKLFNLIACISLTLVVGAVSGIATASSIADWYVSLNKPSFNPPNYLFGPVWTLLYILMGISLYLITQVGKSPLKTRALTVFFIQLFLNFSWSFLFFKFHFIGFAFIEIVGIWLAILLMILTFYKLNKTAAYLQIPYLLWVSFASVLNGSIWFLNH